MLTAFPSAKLSLLHKYENDSIIGTWERLADIVYPGGVRQLKRDAGAYYGIGKFKCDCAEKIGSVMDIRHNMSPSFNYFISKFLPYKIICSIKCTSVFNSYYFCSTPSWLNMFCYYLW